MKNRDELQQGKSLRLKALRVRLKMTQRELANEFYVTPGAIALWESNKREVPGPIVRLMELYENALDSQKNTEKS